MRGPWISLVAGAVVGIALLSMLTGGAAAQEVAVDVTVVNGSGAGVGGADINASWDGGATTATTLSGGVAVFEVPEGEDITISIDHPDYVRNRPYTIRNATVPEEESRLAVEIPVSLAGTATVTVEDSDGTVPEASVEFRDGVPIDRVTTGSDGVAETKRIEQGEYRVILRKPGYLRKSTRLTVDGDVSERIGIERGSATVQFNVTDDHFDPPQAVSGARIEVSDDSFTTRDTGLRSTDLEVNRQYEITISKAGYETVTDTLDIGESDQQYDVSIQRTPNLTMLSANDRVVVNESTRVTVTDEYEDPVAGATVSLNGEQVGETSDDGTADVRIPVEGEHEISATADGLDASVSVEGISPGAADDSAEESDDGETTEATDDEEQAEEPETEESADGDGPGFGVVVALVSLLSTALLLRRR